jgi:hypothetical protein
LVEELLDPIDKFRHNVELVTIDPTVRQWYIRSGVGRAQLREAVKQARNTQGGRRWRQGNLHPILVKPTIAGLVRHPEKPQLVRARWGTFVECSQHGDDPGCFGAIISECDWNKLQLILSKPGRSRNPVTTALLTGWVYCGYPDRGKKLVATRDHRGKRVTNVGATRIGKGAGGSNGLPTRSTRWSPSWLSQPGRCGFAIPVVSGNDDFAALDAEIRRLKKRQEQLAIDHYRLDVIKRRAVPGRERSTRGRHCCAQAKAWPGQYLSARYIASGRGGCAS